MTAPATVPVATQRAPVTCCWTCAGTRPPAGASPSITGGLVLAESSRKQKPECAGNWAPPPSIHLMRSLLERNASRSPGVALLTPYRNGRPSVPSARRDLSRSRRRAHFATRTAESECRLLGHQGSLPSGAFWLLLLRAWVPVWRSQRGTALGQPPWEKQTAGFDDSNTISDTKTPAFGIYLDVPYIGLAAHGCLVLPRNPEDSPSDFVCGRRATMPNRKPALASRQPENIRVML